MCETGIENINSRISPGTSLTRADLWSLATRKGITSDFEILWFADAEHKWYSRTHYIIVKWWEWIYPLILKFLKDSYVSLPFFLVWSLAIFVWFFIELTVGSAEFFNLKHNSNATHCALINYEQLFFKINNNYLNLLFVKTYIKGIG